MTAEKRIQVNHRTGTYPVVIGTDLLAKLGGLVEPGGTNSPIGIISNTTVNEIYGDQVRDSLQAAGYVTRTILVPDGEKFKTLASAEQVIQALLAQGLERSSTIVTLGGGVITDLGGFVASIIFRGVRLIHIPTTLLSMVDAAVGGKTGVNHSSGKNLIGSFYQPDLVLMDTSTLSTLGPRDMISGYAEMVKMGVIRDPEYLLRLGDMLETLQDEIGSSRLVDALARSVALKAEVVEADEHEADLRRILNFGHTLGHAIETTLGYGVIRHGEAVVLGMYGAGWLSHQLAGLSDQEWEDLSALLTRIPVDAPIESLDTSEVERVTMSDKKVANSQLFFVLLEAIGKPKMQAGIPSLMVKLAVDAIKKAWSKES